METRLRSLRDHSPAEWAEVEDWLSQQIGTLLAAKGRAVRAEMAYNGSGSDADRLKAGKAQEALDVRLSAFYKDLKEAAILDPAKEA